MQKYLATFFKIILFGKKLILFRKYHKRSDSKPLREISSRLRSILLKKISNAVAWYSQSGKSGGAKRDRTDDLYNAIVALSQLSYSPTRLETGPVLTCNTGFVEAYFRK